MAKKAVDVFEQVKGPDAVISMLIFNDCSQLQTEDTLALAKKVSSNLSASRMSNPFIISSLIHMLMKSGDVKGAEGVFTKTDAKCLPIYGAMMKGEL